MSAKAKNMNTRTIIYILIVVVIIAAAAFIILNLPEEKPVYNLDQIYADPNYYIEKGEIIVEGYYYSQRGSLVKTILDSDPIPDLMLQLDNTTGFVDNIKYHITGKLHYTEENVLELIVHSYDEV